MKSGCFCLRSYWRGGRKALRLNGTGCTYIDIRKSKCGRPWKEHGTLSADQRHVKNVVEKGGTGVCRIADVTASLGLVGRRVC